MAKQGENQDPEGQDPEGDPESQERSLDNVTDPEILKELVKKNREEAKQNRLEKNRLKKDLDKRIKDEEEAKRKQEEEQGNYKKLYEESNTQIETLKARIAELEPLATSIETSLKDRVKALPKSIQELAPEGLSLAAMNEWVSKAEKAAKVDSGNQQQQERRLAPEGNRSGPPPASGKDAKAVRLEEDIAVIQRGGGYTM